MADLKENFFQAIKYPGATAKLATTYFTIWSLALLFLYSLLIFVGLDLSKYINFVLLATGVSLASLFIVYVYPKYIRFTIKDKKFELKGLDLTIIDIIMHQIPCLIVLSLYLFRHQFTITKFNTLVSLIIIAIYLVFNNIEERYGVTVQETAFITTLVTICNLSLY